MSEMACMNWPLRKESTQPLPLTFWASSTLHHTSWHFLAFVLSVNSGWEPVHFTQSWQFMTCFFFNMQMSAMITEAGMSGGVVGRPFAHHMASTSWSVCKPEPPSSQTCALSMSQNNCNGAEDQFNSLRTNRCIMCVAGSWRLLYDHLEEEKKIGIW